MVSANDIFRGTFDKTEIFEITRRTPRARAFSWIGTALFGFCLCCSAQVVFLFISETSHKNLMIRFVIAAVVAFVFAICFWITSHQAQKGTITISNDKISCKCERALVEMMPEEVTSVQREGDEIIIYFSRRKLVIKSDKASQIENRVKDFISAYKYSDRSTAKTESQGIVSADKIREYKQLVDDGIISQEQFDQIINKITKQ